MTTVKAQASKLMHNLAATLRGTSFTVRLHHAHDNDGFIVYAALYGDNVRDKGAQLCTIPDLSLDNIPYILAQLSEATGRRINFNVYVTAKRDARTIYFIEVPNASGVRRIGKELATALHESAIRDDNISVAGSRRTSEISFCEYTEHWLYETLEY